MRVTLDPVAAEHVREIQRALSRHGYSCSESALASHLLSDAWGFWRERDVRPDLAIAEMLARSADEPAPKPKPKLEPAKVIQMFPDKAKKRRSR